MEFVSISFMPYHQRNRAQALTYCELQDGELAKITGKAIYDQLRVIVPIGSKSQIQNISYFHEFSQTT